MKYACLRQLILIFSKSLQNSTYNALQIRYNSFRHIKELLYDETVKLDLAAVEERMGFTDFDSVDLYIGVSRNIAAGTIADLYFCDPAIFYFPG